MGMQEQTDSLRDVLLRSAFAIPFCVANVIGIASSYLLEKANVEQSSAPAVLVDETTIINVLMFAFVVSGMIFANTTSVTKLVADGGSPPIKLERLASMPWPYGQFCSRKGDRNIFSFLFFCLLFPGLIVVVALYSISLAVNGPATFLRWVVPLHFYLACGALWRMGIISTIYTVNYLAAHNPTQSVLIPATEEQTT